MKQGFLLCKLVLVLSLLFSTFNSGAEARRHHRSHSGAHSYKRASQCHPGKHRSRVHHRQVAHPVARMPQQIGALVVSESGQTIMDELSNIEFNPASVAKLVTAYGAIKTFGIEHKFATRVYLDGKLDEPSGKFDGDVYVEGCDPDFRRLDALELSTQLAEAGVKKVNGRLVVSSNFSYGSASDPTWSGRALLRSFTLGKRIPFTKGVAVGTAPGSSRLVAEHESESFRDTLKLMLSYSQNSVAEQIGRAAGGVGKMAAIVEQASGLDSGSLKLASGSGLGKSRITPKDMMLVLKSLRNELQGYGLDLQDICPVAGVDRGTLDERFTDPSERGSVVGKTGTLPGTDGGTSTLVGMFRTQKEDYYFVIFCWRGNVVSFRHQQDDMIRKLQSAHGGPRPFSYNIASAGI